MHIGYARVSTHDQNLALQQDALKKAGCQKIVIDRISGTVAERPGLAQIKELLREGDTLVVWRFDRLGRSIKDLIAWVSWLGLSRKEWACRVCKKPLTPHRPVAS